MTKVLKAMVTWGTPEFWENCIWDNMERTLDLRRFGDWMIIFHGLVQNCQPIQRTEMNAWQNMTAQKLGAWICGCPKRGPTIQFRGPKPVPGGESQISDDRCWLDGGLDQPFHNTFGSIQSLDVEINGYKIYNIFGYGPL